MGGIHNNIGANKLLVQLIQSKFSLFRIIMSPTQKTEGHLVQICNDISGHEVSRTPDQWTHKW